jgi:hypothetical protein
MPYPSHPPWLGHSDYAWRRVQVITLYNCIITLGRQRFDSRQGVEGFLYRTESRPALGPTQPPSQWVQRARCPKVKRPGRKVDLTHSSSAEVKNSGAIPPLPLHLNWRAS